MKKFFLILFSFIYLIPLSFAQRNYAQELVNLLQQGKCFEAKEFHLQYADKLPKYDKALDLLYKSHMALFFNKPDSAAFYLEDLLIGHEHVFGPSASFYYGKILRIYTDSQQFEKGLGVCDQVTALYNKYASMINKDVLQNELAFVESTRSSLRARLNNEPIIKIKRTNSVEPIKLITDEYIRFYGNYNGNSIETWFDTGVSSYMQISKKVADKLDVKIVHVTQDSIQIVNGTPQKGYEGVIDSIIIGNINLYNIPVLVVNKGFMPYLPDSVDDEVKRRVREIFNDEQVMMGLPTMKLIGKFQFDRKNSTLNFPENVEFKEPNNASSNIYFYDQRAYLGLKINNLNYVGFFDTGSNNFVDLSFPFYEKNKKSILIDSTTQKLSSHNYSFTYTIVGAPHEIVKDATLLFNNKKINCKQYQVRIFDNVQTPGNIFDGIVGVNFLKELGSKIIIDFDNMKIEEEGTITRKEVIKTHTTSSK